MKYLKILLLSLFVISSYSYAQETEVEAPTNLDKLLELVKEGKSKEQGENKQREAEEWSERWKWAEAGFLFLLSAIMLVLWYFI